ncbi:MAG: Stk1 family PASTA domain-containing Ser/Thr kinase [Solirubrobacteraceae bacterium]|nr:Stk1 family PASTA domain-containing Ser/Thr kinase [Solirubrobacteraceae bacterium]
MSTPIDAPDEGTVIDGRYQVISRLGAGGMAEVFCAEDLQLGRKVALKLLYRRFAEDAEFVERFRREASHAAGLQHPNVVSVYDRGQWDGTYYIAMEYLEGRSLKDLITETGPLPLAEAIDVTTQVLRAAKFAHKRGIVHRDLKPHNVIVDESDPTHPRVKVTDFGIARAGASDMTQTGSIMGTAQYLSPEQAQGHPTGPAADLYSIGVMLYELVTGRVPFEGESAVTIALKQVSEEPRPPSQLNPAVTPELEDAILRALSKDPAHRQADAEQFIGELEHAQALLPDPDAIPPGEIIPPPEEWPADAPISGEHAAEPWAPPEEEERDGTNRTWLWALGLGLLVAIVAVAALLLSGNERVTVPSVVGASLASATDRLEDEGFEVVTVRENSTRERNEVIGQDPSGGTRAEQGSRVRLTVSDGPGTATVPDVVGEGRNAARQALEDAGFEVEEDRESSDEVTENRVIEQRPSGGQQATTGATVTIVVSTGAERVDVPNVVGQSEDAARSALQDAGFTAVVTEEETSDAQAGTVLRQSPAGGARAQRGSRVSIVVAAEPAEVAVPDVTGRSQANATSTLRNAGFDVNVTTTEVDSPDEDDRVQSQSPSGGRAERGSTVTITVGEFDPDLNPDPEPETTPQTTPQTTPAEPTG